MLLPVALLARTDEHACIIGSTSSGARLLLSGIEDMKNLLGMGGEEKHS